MVTIPLDCNIALATRTQIDEAGGVLCKDPFDLNARRKVECFRLFRLAHLNGLLEELLAHTASTESVVAARLKRLATIIRKLGRHPKMSLTRMGDTVGARIVCDSVQTATELVSRLKQLPSVSRMRDYTSVPQPTGYRAVHLDFKVAHQLPGSTNLTSYTVEVQVRTFYQHLWALVSESMGEQVKEGGGDAAQRRYLTELSIAISERESLYPDEKQRQLPANAASEVIVARLGKGTDAPLMHSFGQDYGRAIEQLINWEDDPEAGFSDCLLLVGATGSKGLGYTHSTFLGMKRIPLPVWMPEQP